MIEQIKQIVKNVLENEKLTEYISGTVSSVSPLIIRVNQKLELPESVIIKTSLVSNNLEINDKLIMLRVERGQKYIILSKVV
jgi:uncharacterized protein with PhoU and TrkA domain